ncbi:MAG: prolyl oligopeptidase family serine peptidase [Acidobacteria bacterium]|nr:prolyl oligopeptidase family serine peptidase [Acidobacteriota bacterium]NIM61765.1 prolyl oligopeptidase family serine peptidase [Acidobacteriota bacterium]NIO60009.1 prolyl oligopeptidase family serine peptidase [Acidobacteriota bacterium]NIQ29201.1 prolyl oligopeptidase family serine peptidase [Acidobacteriota bacterium]NIQ83775.1 prolyl oligopeptidase family serine peptidase [Acidobacteriota bacterium]
MRPRFLVTILVAFLAVNPFGAAKEEDPYLWLEEVEGDKALTWAKELSAATAAEFEAVPEFEELHDQLLKIFTSRDRIPRAGIRGAWVYNYWQDEDHVRGIWRRTFLDEYVKESPSWEIVLDLDELAEAEGENWVWKGSSCLPPGYRLCMVTLSRGGGDASVRREFDTVSKKFVEGGFYVPESKARVSWKDENTLWIGTDFGAGTLTKSGYPRFSKEWERGLPLEAATTVFEGSVEDVSVSTFSMHTPEGRYDIVRKTPEFFRGTSYMRLGERLVKIDVPDDASMQGVFKDRMLIALRSDWTVGGKTYPGDALLAIDVDDFLAGGRDFDVLFEPEERVSLGGVSSTLNHLLLTTLDNVRGRLYRLTPGEDGWKKEEISLPGLGTIGLGSTSDVDDSFFFTYTDFLTPSSLYFVRDGGEPQQIKTSPSWFDPEGMSVEQFEAPSVDGVMIPYFVFKPKGFEANGANPTLLYGYGGFEVSQVPRYSGSTGSAWVSRGGVYVLANIRGGGEFGPEWHRAAMQENHQTNFDDFAAVAEDLIKRNITSPDHLGIMGGSQGGLLVGGTFTQRPELFKAVVCLVPLLDMKRYNKLLAGNSWMAEYGNPDTDDWDYIKKWSPYHNLDKKKDYPKVFFATSTRDDRVHPGHARKMVKRMLDMGKDVYYYENTEGGHAAAANLNQRAYMSALNYAYLWMMLQ